jgi:hypothetical protein
MYVGSEVLTTVNMLLVVFRFLTPCGVVVGYERFGGMYRLFTDPEYTSETLVTTYKTTRCHNPEDHDQSFKVDSFGTYTLIPRSLPVQEACLRLSQFLESPTAVSLHCVQLFSHHQYFRLSKFLTS